MVINYTRIYYFNLIEMGVSQSQLPLSSVYVVSTLPTVDELHSHHEKHFKKVNSGAGERMAGS